MPYPLGHRGWRKTFSDSLRPASLSPSRGSVQRPGSSLPWFWSSWQPNATGAFAQIPPAPEHPGTPGRLRMSSAVLTGILSSLRVHKVWASNPGRALFPFVSENLHPVRTSIKKEFARQNVGAKGREGTAGSLGKASVTTFILLSTLLLRPRVFPSPKSTWFLADPSGLRSLS